MSDEQTKRGPEPGRRNQLRSFLRARRGSVQVLDMAELCDLTGIPRRSLDRALTQLREAGKVSVTRRTSRTGPVTLEVVA